MSQKPSFKPWKRDGYRASNNRFGGVRVLVVGASHYGWEGLDRDLSKHESFTEDVVDGWGQWTPASDYKSLSFFTSIARILLGCAKEPLASLGEVYRNRPEVWNDAAFYNYIQTFVGNDPSDKPTPADWDTGVEPFRWLLHDLDPHVILVVSTAVTRRLRDKEPALENRSGVIWGPHPQGCPLPLWEDLARRFHAEVQRAKDRAAGGG